MTMSRLLVLLALGWISVGTAWAQVGISPRTLEVVLDQDGRSHSFRLFNLSEKPFSASVTVTHWTMDENNQVSLIPSTASSLDQWMIVNPLRFTIPPGESQTIRVGFRPQMELAEGEYRALVYFNQELPPDEKPETRQLRSRLRIGAAVYAHVGEVRKNARIDDVRVDGDQVTLAVTNTGNAHVRLDGQWSVWREDAYPGVETTAPIIGLGKKEAVLPSGVISADWLPKTPILPGQTRTLTFQLTDLPQDAASFILDMDAQFAGQALNRAESFGWAGHVATENSGQ